MNEQSKLKIVNDKGEAPIDRLNLLLLEAEAIGDLVIAATANKTDLSWWTAAAVAYRITEIAEKSRQILGLED